MWSPSFIARHQTSWPAVEGADAEAGAAGLHGVISAHEIHTRRLRAARRQRSINRASKARDADASVRPPSIASVLSRRKNIRAVV